MKMLHKPLVILAACAIAACSLAQGAKPSGKHRISASQASAAALKKYPGTVVGKVALENEDGKWEYAVNVRSGHKLREVMVDAGSGKIASVEVTTPAEEAKEKAAELKKGKGKKGGKVTGG